MSTFRIAAAVLLLAAGCTDDLPQEQTAAPASRDAVLRIAVDAFRSEETLAAETESFAANDEIRLYYHDTFTDLHTADGLRWLPALSWKEIGSGETRFVGVSPRSGNGTMESYRFAVPSDQSTTADYRAADLKSAVATAVPAETITLTFKHLLSRVCVNLTGLSSHPLVQQGAEVSVEVHAVTQGVFSLAEQSGETESGAAQWVKTHREGDRFCALIPPQPMAAFQGAEGWIRITIGSKSTLFAAPQQLEGSAFTALLSGREVTVNLSVSGTAESFANQTRFVYGVHIPEDTDWQFGLDWKPGQGWFDVDKESPDAETGTDSNMCWAASACNLIHWWVENNNEYIARYEQQSGKAWGGPTQYNGSLSSEVFHWIKSKKSNTGGQIASAVNLYLAGVFYYNYDYRERITDPIDDPTAGFALPVIGPIVLAERYGMSGGTPLSKELFNEGMKKAFRENRAVGFSIPQHALTLWGADFDANGEVSSIYAVDNNNNPNSLFRIPIKYSNGGTYTTNSLGQVVPRSAIVQLVLLDLGRDLWDAYFEQEPK